VSVQAAGKREGWSNYRSVLSDWRAHDPSPPAVGLCCRQADGAQSCRIRRKNDKTRRALRPIEASKAAVSYVRETSTPAVRSGSSAVVCQPAARSQPLRRKSPVVLDRTRDNGTHYAVDVAGGGRSRSGPARSTGKRIFRLRICRAARLRQRRHLAAVAPKGALAEPWRRIGPRTADGADCFGRSRGPSNRNARRWDGSRHRNTRDATPPAPAQHTPSAT
jgi:hypothetical protein